MEDESNTTIEQEVELTADDLPCSSSKPRAFIVGASGEVGRELLKVMQQKQAFSEVVVIGRRKMDDELFMDVEQRIVDFENLEEFADDFNNFDMGFCCLGTTRSKEGTEGFYKVDHDYVVSVAMIAKEKGCKHFSVVSSAGSNKNSMFLYPKTKGLMEEHIKDIGFERLSIFKPAMLLCDRQESRPFEKLTLTVLSPVIATFPSFLTVPTSFVAKSMVTNAFRPLKQSLEIFSNKDIHNMVTGAEQIQKVKAPQ